MIKFVYAYLIAKIPFYKNKLYRNNGAEIG